jgi:hypothetical protein
MIFLMNIGKTLMVIGGALLLLGGLWMAGEKIGLGRLPGDLTFRGKNYTIHLPLATSLLFSVALSLVAWLVGIFRR